MTETTQTIAEQLQARLATLTRAERQLAHAILANYPAAGLGPLAALAREAAAFKRLAKAQDKKKT